jgi:hypothetical protein
MSQPGECETDRRPYAESWLTFDELAAASTSLHRRHVVF